MGFTVIDVAQRSAEWEQARLGRLTASRANDMLSYVKSGEAAARANLRVQLVLERLTGKSLENPYQSQAMLDGIAREADALRRYEALTGRLVRSSGFLAHDTLQAGASLDGHLGEFQTLVEAKSPIPATHLEYVRTGLVPTKYARQITHQLWITGAAACDFVSWHPDFPERLRLLVVRVPRNEDVIAQYEKAARAFLTEVDAECQAIATMTNPTQVFQAAVA